MSGCRCTADLGMFKCLFFKKHLKETDLSAVLWLQTFWFTKLLPSRHTQTNHLFIHRSIFMLLPRIKINKDQSSRLSSCHHLCHIHPSNAPSIHSLTSLFCLSTLCHSRDQYKSKPTSVTAGQPGHLPCYLL